MNVELGYKLVHTIAVGLSRHLASLPLSPPFTRGRFAVAFE